MEAVAIRPSILDFGSLLAPIPGANPAGQRLRYSPVYDAIQEARREDENLPQGEWKRKPKTADWPSVVSLASKALAEQGKDLEVAAWLVEALVKIHGFAGLREGLRLLRELNGKFWDSLYPTIENNDMEPRAKPLEWLNDKLPRSVTAVPLTHDGAAQNYSWSRWEESRVVDNFGRQNSEAHEAAIAEGKITGDQFDKAVASSPRLFYESLLTDLTESREQYDALSAAVDEKFGREAPSLLNIKAALEDCFSLVERIVKEKRERDPSYHASHAGDASMTTMETSRDDASASPSSDGQARPSESRTVALEPIDRADALRRLDAVAAYFRKREPHSPVAYLVERAIQWGKMPLDQWLKDVISNDDVLSHVRETLGLKAKSE